MKQAARPQDLIFILRCPATMTPVGTTIRTMMPLLSLLLLAWGQQSALALPMQMTINQRSSECLYDTLKEGESVSASVFILSGPELKATLTVEGPVANMEVINGSDLQTQADEWAKRSRDDNLIDFSAVVDFEHLKPEIEDDDEATMAAAAAEDKEPLDEKDPEYTEKKRQRREKQREAFLAAKQKREKQRALEQLKVRQDGEPYEVTLKASQEGWYRVCVHGTWYQVLAEMEMRKESDLGGLGENGHVLTYEQQVMDEEDTILAEDTASKEGIKDEDFQETREKIKNLRRLLNEISTMQQKERRRLTVHAETNEHSHSRMVLSSLLETLLFMAVTGYQVYTIRRWFSGAPVLG